MAAFRTRGRDSEAVGSESRVKQPSRSPPGWAASAPATRSSEGSYKAVFSAF